MPYRDREQQREYQRNWIARRRQEWLDANGPCTDCGSGENLEVDHVDPAVKVSHRIWSWTKARRMAELAKCVVRCRDCHLRRTRDQRSRPITHGTHSGYAYYGCHCAACTVGHAEYQQQLRHRTG